MLIKLRYPALPGLICNLLSILKMCPSGFRVSSSPGPGGEWAGFKPGLKPSLDRWGCACKISPRSVQGFGFPLALHIPTDRQTNKQTSVRTGFCRMKTVLTFHQNQKLSRRVFFVRGKNILSSWATCLLKQFMAPSILKLGKSL